MKILIGMTRSDTVASGSFKHIVQIGERFSAEGAEVAYVIGKTGPCSEILTAKGYKVYALPHLERELTCLKDLVSLFQLIWVILSFKPTLCTWHTAKIGALGRIASLLTLRRSFYVPHGVPFYDCPQNKGYKQYRRLEKILAYLPTTIVGVCHFDTNQYRALGVPERKLLTIHNGMRPMPLTERVITSETKVKFITAARFENQKDYDTLATAVHKLAPLVGSFELHIYGDGRKEVETRQLFGALVDDAVFFHPVVNDFAPQLRDAHVFLLSSHWEGLPRTIIEAMSYQMPVIATDVGGVREMIDHGNSGYLVAPEDAESFAAHMQTYIEKPTMIAEHGWNSHKKYEAEFTLARMLDRYVDSYIDPVREASSVALHKTERMERRAESVGDV